MAKILLLAMLAESIWETFKLVWQKNKICVDRVGSIIICLVLALGAQIDLFEMVGIPLAIPHLGEVFTGVIASRGANFVHDLFKLAEGLMVKNKL
ncbi:MAG: hypothetical protein ACOX0E_00585 [Syntrophomonadaceae bacterium]|jgi:hypothetical protein